MLPSDEEKIYAAIGRMAIESGRTETLLMILADGLVNRNQPNLGKAFTTDCPLNRLIDAVLWLYSQTNGKHPRELKNVVDEISKYASLRNDIIHAYVSVGTFFDQLIPNTTPTPPQIGAFKFKHHNRRGPEAIRREYSLQELNDIADSMSAVSSKLNEFIAEVHAPAT